MLPARGRMKPPKSARDKNLAEPEALIEISLEVNFRARSSISLFCCCTMTHCCCGVENPLHLHGEWRSEKLPPRSLEERERPRRTSRHIVLLAALKKCPDLIICKTPAQKFHTRLRRPIRRAPFALYAPCVCNCNAALVFYGPPEVLRATKLLSFLKRPRTQKDGACILSHMRIIKGNAILLPFSLEISAERRKRVLLNCALC